MANKITTVIDFVTTGAQRSVKSFRESIADADGAFGKFKAGASSALAGIAANLGTLAVAGGATAVALGTKVVNAFQATALEAGKLADATGLTVEAASRLREVSSDLGISGETVTTIVKKLTVELGKGNPLLEEYGISLQKTSDGAADVNATLLNTIKRIQAIEDPTKRAAAAQAAFGRGFADAAELISTDADELKRKLDAVSDAKVVTPEELARAREFRDTMEELRDVGEDLAVSAGGVLVPVLQDVADALQDVEVAAKKIPGGLPSWLSTLGKLNPLGQQVVIYKKVADGVEFLTSKWDGAAPKADRFSDSILRGADAAEQAAPLVQELGDITEDTADELVDLGDKAANAGPKIGDMAGALDDAEQHLADLNDQARDKALDELAGAIKGVGDALDDAFGDVEDDLGKLDLLDDIADQFDTIADKSDKSTRQQAADVRRLQSQLLDLLRTREDLKPDQVIEFITRIRSGDVDSLKQVLADLTKDLFVNVHINPPTSGFTGSNVDFNPDGGRLLPTFNGVTDNRNITIIYPVGSTPTTQYIDGQIDQRRNGTRNPNLI